MRSPAAAGRLPKGQTDEVPCRSRMMHRQYFRLDKPLKIRYNIARYEKAMTRNERGEPPAKASRGRCKPGGRNAAQPSEKPPVKNRPYACVKGERGCAFGHANRSGTANRVCSSPGRQALFISQ